MLVNRIVYIVGAMVVIVALLGFLGEIAILVHGSAHLDNEQTRAYIDARQACTSQPMAQRDACNDAANKKFSLVDAKSGKSACRALRGRHAERRMPVWKNPIRDRWPYRKSPVLSLLNVP
jgi:hypothetical protein